MPSDAKWRGQIQEPPPFPGNPPPPPRNPDPDRPVPVEEPDDLPPPPLNAAWRWRRPWR